MSIKKFRGSKQLFIAVSCIVMGAIPLAIRAEGPLASTQSQAGAGDIIQNADSDAETIRDTLKKSWHFARKKSNKELADLTANAIDTFAQLYRDYRELLLATEDRKQSIISLQNTLIGEQEYIERIGDLHNEILQSQNETRKAYNECEQLRTELRKVQEANNNLRAQIALSTSA